MHTDAKSRSNWQIDWKLEIKRPEQQKICSEIGAPLSNWRRQKFGTLGSQEIWKLQKVGHPTSPASHLWICCRTRDSEHDGWVRSDGLPTFSPELSRIFLHSCEMEGKLTKERRRCWRRRRRPWFLCDQHLNNILLWSHLGSEIPSVYCCHYQRALSSDRAEGVQDIVPRESFNLYFDLI